MSRTTLRITCRGAHHGQIDASILVEAEGRLVGCLDYSVYEGIAAIQMIEVAESHRRQGLATRMVRHLQAEHPGAGIEWGMLTPEGAHFRDSLPVRSEPSDDAPRFARLARLRAKIAAIRATGTSAIEQLTEMYGMIHIADELERDLIGRSPTREIILPGTPA